MADIALVTADKVNVGQITNLQLSTVAGEAITAGAPCYIKGTDGKAYNSDADGSGTTTCAGIALRTVAAGQPLTLLRRGLLDGLDLSSLNYWASVYVSNTVGRLADAAGTTSINVGKVLPVNGQQVGSNPDKVLLVECP